MSIISDKLRIGSICSGKPLLGPKKVNLHLTDRCNLKCLFCWYHSRLASYSSFKKGGTLKYEVLEKVIKDCSELKVETISLESEGETLLYPRILDLVKSIKNHNIKVEIFTNCCFSAPKNKVLFLADHLMINLSATNDELYSKIHADGKSGYFDKVISNLSALSKFKSKFGKPNIELIFILNSLNFKQIEQIFKIGEKFNVDKVSIKQLEATFETGRLLIGGRETEYVIKKCLQLEKRIKIKNNLSNIIKILSKPEFNRNSYSIEKNRLHNDRLFYFSVSDYKKINCYVGWFYAFVDSVGRVIAPCDNVGILSVGNIYKNSFKDIWFSRKFNNLRKEAEVCADPKVKKWQECKYCAYLDFNNRIKARLEETAVAVD